MNKRIPLVSAFVLASGLAFGQTSLEVNDTNDDGQLSKDEYYGLVSDAGNYSNWDTNGDRLLDETEFDEFGIDSGFDTWDADADGYINDDEFYDGKFEYYDENGDGYWDDDEWDDAGELGS